MEKSVGGKKEREGKRGGGLRGADERGY